VPKNCSVQFVTLTVSECKDDTASKTIKLGGDATSAQLKFLKTGTQYDYRLTFRLSNAVETTVSGTLRTAATPRILNIGGLVNVRDIGGWKTVDGKRIRQGLLYRGSEMDGAVHAEYRITENGISDMLTVLGIRSDIDLRTALGESARSALGANVNYLSYTFPAYTGIFSTDYRSEICRVFADLAKPEIYPAYLHCTYGMDRTGTAYYLLEALLGVAEEDLIRDYELSGLVHTGLTRENLIGMVAQLNTFEGDTLQQKVEHYLLDIGVTQQQISSIRHILLEDK
jgi:hypothetical protein